MVDFQSRDTKRTRGDSDDEDAAADEEETANEGETADEEETAGDEGEAADGTTVTGDVSAGGAETTDETGTATSSAATDPEDGSGVGGGSETGRDGTVAPGATAAESDVSVSYAVVTVTAERTLGDDTAGDAVVEAVEAAGGGVATRELLDPSYDGVQAAVDALVGRGDVDAVVTVGGTGVGPADVTVDAAGDLFGKRLPGFGEHLRALVREREGTAAVRTRTTAGMIDGVPVFCLPGDPTAVRRGVAVVTGEAGALVAAANPERTDAA
jgi:molybdenum cofactor biosynthesis protein B